MQSFEFEYSLKRTKRKTLGISVDALGSVTVSAPEGAELSKIEALILKRKSWIESKIKEKQTNVQIQSKREFISGESIYLFGRQYILKFLKSPECFVKVSHNRLLFHLNDLVDAKTMVQNYLDEQFQSLVSYKTMECLENFRARFLISVNPRFVIRKMNKRWGSCTSEGVIHLNPMLMAASIECIEYVIYHELIHLICPNHSEKFYQTLRSVCPRFRKLKERLEKETVLFM